MRRAGVGEGEVEHIVFGNVHQTSSADVYLSRVVAIQGGVGNQAAALTINRLCASGLQAIISAAQYIELGDARIAIAGGAEVMSRIPHVRAAYRPAHG